MLAHTVAEKPMILSRRAFCCASSLRWAIRASRCCSTFCLRSWTSLLRRNNSSAVDKGCLIEIDEAPFLGIGGVALTLEFGQLRLQQLVGDGLAARRHGVLAGQEHLRAQQGVADLLEDEGVELVGTDIALRATGDVRHRP